MKNEQMKPKHTLAEMNTLALIFTRRLKERLSREQWAEVIFWEGNESTCVDDFCDSNQMMVDAFREMVGREAWFPRDVKNGKVSEEQMYDDTELMDDAKFRARLMWQLEHLNNRLADAGYGPLNDHQVSVFLRDDRTSDGSEKGAMMMIFEKHYLGN